jgi:hypothetical protein
MASRIRPEEVVLPHTTVSIRRMGYDWGVAHEGALVGRHQSQARAVVAAHALAERLRSTGHEVDMRFDGTPGVLTARFRQS